jgi:hypothetical protein
MHSYRSWQTFHLFTLLAGMFLILLTAARAEDPQNPQATSSRSKRHLRNMGALFLEITTDKTGAVARVDFLNHPPDYVQERIRKEIIGKHFGAPNHTFRRHVDYTWYDVR